MHCLILHVMYILQHRLLIWSAQDNVLVEFLFQSIKITHDSNFPLLDRFGGEGWIGLIANPLLKKQNTKKKEKIVNTKYCKCSGQEAHSISSLWYY